MSTHRLFSAIAGLGLTALAQIAFASDADLARTGAPAPARTEYRYVSPVPGSVHISPSNNIIIRDGRTLDRASLASVSLSVTGSRSGPHSGRLVLSDDDKTIVFNPDQPFSFGETVSVRLDRGPRTREGAALLPVAFTFRVAPTAPLEYVALEDIDGPDAMPEAPAPVVPLQAIAPALTASDLPASYPPVTLLVSNNPDPGLVFCTPARNTPPASNVHMMILDNDAMPIFYRKTGSRPVDLKLLPDGRLLYFEIGKNAGYAMDSTYAVVDSFKAGNGYTADSHDILVLPNDHAFLMIYDPQPVDMSVIVPGGNPNATVIGLVLQELDEAKNVVWQWRSWDHLEITDLSAACATLTAATIDYVHGNSFDLDLDGNLVVSGRYLNEFFKIDRQTGDVLWRFGPHAVRNQFTITGDSLGFSDQHDVRVLPNGHYTVFDNHFCIDPKHTRVLEYALDPQALTATQVWDYHHIPDLLSTSGGGYQRRDNGGGMIGWANVNMPPHITDLHADGSVAWELQFWAPPVISLTYRAYRFPWRGTAFTTDVDSLDFGTVAVGDEALLPLTVTNRTASSITLTSFVSLDSAFSVTDAPPITLGPDGSVTVQAKFHPDHAGDFRRTLYVRSGTATQLIAQTVVVSGRGDTPTPVLLASFEAGWTDAGIEVSWRLDGPDLVATTVQRSENPAGPWVEIAGELRQGDNTTTLIDRSAVTGQGYYYRLAETMANGQTIFSQPLAVPGRSVADGVALLRVTPNPARGATGVAYVVPSAARVRVSVMDAQGRRVTVLADGWHAAGEYHAAWNEAASRQRVPAGLYFVRYEGPWRTIVRRLAMTR